MHQRAPVSLNMASVGKRIFTSGQLGRETGLLRSQVQALSAKGLIPFIQTEAGHRLYNEADIPQVIAAATEAGYLKSPEVPRGRSYDEFEEALAGIALGTDLFPLTANQKETLFDWFRNARPEPWPTVRGPEVVYDPNHGTEAQA